MSIQDGGHSIVVKPALCIESTDKLYHSEDLIKAVARKCAVISKVMHYHI